MFLTLTELNVFVKNFFSFFVTSASSYKPLPSRNFLNLSKLVRFVKNFFILFCRLTVDLRESITEPPDVLVCVSDHHIYIT